MKIIKQICLLIIGFIITLMVCELFLKNGRISEVSFAEFYPDIGKGLAKPKKYIYFNEGFSIVTTNKSRYIGKNVSKNKTANTIRIAFLGDSYIESIQVFERHYFGNIAQEILAKEFPKKNIEILNFGRSHFNFGNMYAYQKLLIDDFTPDFVIYFLSNDDLNLNDAQPPLLPKTIMVDKTLKIYTDYDKEQLRAYQKTKFLTQNFSLASMLNSARRKINHNEFLPIILGKLYKVFEPFNKKVPVKANKPQKLNTITKEIVNNLNSNTIIVNRDIKNLPDEFKSLCITKKHPYWELKPSLDSLNNSGSIHNKWAVSDKSGHWNHTTHKVIGKFLARKTSSLIKNKKNKN